MRERKGEVPETCRIKRIDKLGKGHTRGYGPCLMYELVIKDPLIYVTRFVEVPNPVNLRLSTTVIH